MLSSVRAAVIGKEELQDNDIQARGKDRALAPPRLEVTSADGRACKWIIIGHNKREDRWPRS
jgi:hypothetical protein